MNEYFYSFEFAVQQGWWWIVMENDLWLLSNEENQ